MSSLEPIHIPVLPKLHHNSSLFRDGWISFMMCGKSGCGKTSLLAQLIPGISDDIRFICIATLVYRNPFHLAIKEWAEKTKRVCVINDDPDKIREFVTTLHRRNWLIPGRQELLLIFDDFSIHNRSTSRYENLVVEAFTRWRNLGVNIIVVCQDASMVATSCRNCTNLRLLFNSASRIAIHTFLKDVVDRVADSGVLDDLVKYITSVPYSYILVQENPLQVSVGKGVDVTNIMTEHSVSVPTYQELMHEMGAGSTQQLEALSESMQKEMGNTAPQLRRSRALSSLQSRQDDESYTDGSDEG